MKDQSHEDLKEEQPEDGILTPVYRARRELDAARLAEALSAHLLARRYGWRSTPPQRILRDTPRPYTRSRPTCNLSDQILELGIESRRGLKQRRIFAGHHQRRWQVVDDRHALAILVLY